jgi:hypothetical protein
MSVACECCVSGRGLCDGWSLAQRSLTECGVSECDREASTMRRPWTTRGCCAMGGGGGGVSMLSCLCAPLKHCLTAYDHRSIPLPARNKLTENGLKVFHNNAGIQGWHRVSCRLFQPLGAMDFYSLQSICILYKTCDCLALCLPCDQVCRTVVLAIFT